MANKRPREHDNPDRTGLEGAICASTDKDGAEVLVQPQLWTLEARLIIIIKTAMTAGWLC
jgi:hypothetical protein